MLLRVIAINIGDVFLRHSVQYMLLTKSELLRKGCVLYTGTLDDMYDVEFLNCRRWLWLCDGNYCCRCSGYCVPICGYAATNPAHCMQESKYAASTMIDLAT